MSGNQPEQQRKAALVNVVSITEPTSKILPIHRSFGASGSLFSKVKPSIHNSMPLGGADLEDRSVVGSHVAKFARGQPTLVLLYADSKWNIPGSESMEELKKSGVRLGLRYARRTIVQDEKGPMPSEWSASEPAPLEQLGKFVSGHGTLDMRS